MAGTGFRGNHRSNVKRYADLKIEMLEKDFCMRLTNEEKEHFYSLESASDVDHYASYLFIEKL